MTVFISYARADLARVLPVLEYLAESNVDAWYDLKIPGGAEWDALIERKIEECADVLVFISSYSVASKNVRRELKYADSLGKQIIAVLLEATEMKYGLKLLLTSNQMIDMSAPGFALHTILRALRARPERKFDRSDRLLQSMDPQAYVSLPVGSVLLSCAGRDSEVAMLIFAALENLDISVWLDSQQQLGHPYYLSRALTLIDNCSIVVPLLSSNALRPESDPIVFVWRQALSRREWAADDHYHVVPVVIDETRCDEASLPSGLNELRWRYLPRGLPTPDFVESVARLVVSVRSAYGSVYSTSSE